MNDSMINQSVVELIKKESNKPLTEAINEVDQGIVTYEKVLDTNK